MANGDVVSFTIDGKAAANGTACTVTVSTDGSSATKTVKIVLNANDGSTVSYDLVINYKAAITDKIILHVESKYKFIHYWVTGQTGTSKELTKESSSWNGCTLDITSVNLLLSTTDIINGNWSGKTDDLDCTAGEWWYKDGKWTDYNPEDSAPPTITWVSPADGESLSGIETLTVNAADDVGIEKIEFYADDKLIGTITTGNSFSWDSADVANGSHVLKAIAYDKAGNSTESNSVNVTTTNTNKAPVAIISSVGAIFVNTAKTFSAAESYDSNGSIISYAWNFGDGGKGSGVTASHTRSEERR